MTDHTEATDTMTDADSIDYDEFLDICRDHLGEIVTIVGEDSQRVLFSRTDDPDLHSTLIEAGVWADDSPGSYDFSAFVRRSLESRRGRSIVNRSRTFDERADAIGWIEELAVEFNGEELVWQDLPSHPITPDGRTHTDNQASE